MILGCGGVGKSTFAKQLHQAIGIELVHLDQLYFQPNWVEPEKANWEATIRELVRKDSWIMDGNYGGTIDIRLEAADTIIYLDASRWRCLYRVLKRIIRNYGKKREDMAEGCLERFDWAFIRYVFRFNDVKRPKILQQLVSLPNFKKVYVLKSRKEATLFVRKVTMID